MTAAEHADDREFDVVIFGATGFTGSLVAEYLLERYGADGALRWGIAARDRNRLDALRIRLGRPALPLLVADSHDRASLTALASRTRVVAATVGPYAKHGDALVAACVARGTHYCDLAGEVQWIRRMIDTHQAAATASGARIVHCCGFDSIPMDIGVWHLQQAALERHGAHCAAVTTYVRAMRGGGSGGTFASMLNLIDESRRDRSIARLLADPYALNPAGQRDGPDGRDQRDVRFDPGAGGWTAPFVMAGINTRVVRRSHALLGYPWGRDFRYREALLTGRGLRGRLRAMGMAATLGGLVFAASHAGTRRLLEKLILPAPGDGPDAEARENGCFVLHQHGVLADGSVVQGRVSSNRDPGYGSTSRMLGEAAACLAKDPLSAGGGIWTPAAAMAAPLRQRLVANAGIRFDILPAPAAA